MQNFIILLLTVIYMGAGFIGLLPYRMKYRYYGILAGYLILLYTVFVSFLGQWITFPLVLGSAFIVYWGCQRNVWAIILSLSGYLITILVNHLFTIPLSFVDISISDISETYYFPFLIGTILVSILLLLLIRKFFVKPKLVLLLECPGKMQYIILAQLLLGVALIAVNFVYGDAIGYSTEVLTFNGLAISIFTLFTMLLFSLLYQILQENYELKIQQKEQDMLRDYTERMESFYEDFRVFRHDYKNLLSTLSYYIEQKDLPQLENYFKEQILPSGNVLNSDNYVIGKLRAIEIPSVKGILYAKLISALNRGLSPSLELSESLSEIHMNEPDLTKILGILLDNAIEAASLTSEKLLSIAIIITKESVIFSLTNSCPPLEVPVSMLYEKGYSSKEHHDGLGLYTVMNLTNMLDNVFYSVQYDELFRQTLEIRTNVQGAYNNDVCISM